MCMGNFRDTSVKRGACSFALCCSLQLSAAFCCAIHGTQMLSVAFCRSLFLLAVALVCSRLLSVGPRCSGWLSESLCYSHPLQLLNHLISLHASTTCELDLHIKHITLVFKSPLVSDSVHDACTQHISSFGCEASLNFLRQDSSICLVNHIGHAE